MKRYKESLGGVIVGSVLGGPVGGLMGGALTSGSDKEEEYQDKYQKAMTDMENKDATEIEKLAAVEDDTPETQAAKDIQSKMNKTQYLATQENLKRYKSPIKELGHTFTTTATKYENIQPAQRKLFYAIKDIKKIAGDQVDDQIELVGHILKSMLPHIFNMDENKAKTILTAAIKSKEAIFGN